MKRWNKWSHSQCPRCNRNDEDTLHIIMCENDEARENLYDNIVLIDEWMDKYNTHPAIRNIFTTTLFDFNKSTFINTANFMLFNDNSENAILIREAAAEQDAIGWLNLF